MLVKSLLNIIELEMCLKKPFVIQDFQLFIASACCEFCWGLAREGGMATGGSLVSRYSPTLDMVFLWYAPKWSEMIRNDQKFHEESPGLNDMR